MRRTIGYQAAAALLVMTALAPGLRAASLFYSTIEPKVITLGESAKLTITNLDTDTPTPPLPPVTGLQFEIVGHTRQFEFANGTTVPSTSIVVRVTPQTAGTFLIPAIVPGSSSLILRVDPPRGAANTTGPGNTDYTLRPPVQAIAPKKGELQLTAGAAFVRLSLPKRDIFVGESVPVDIEVGARAGVVTAMNGLPTLHGGEFTLNNLSHQPDREEKVIDEKPFVLLTWHSVIAAVKPGAFSLSVETPLTIKISTRSKQDSAIDELLGDPFMQRYYGGSVAKPITVVSPADALTVLAVPTTGRPAAFGGAVGSFTIATEVTPAAPVAGEPVALSLRVTGSGNFDRVNSTMFDHLDDWKAYPPKSSFHQTDAIGYRGEKLFEQPLIASQPGTHTVPALQFSYFDPVARRFVTVASNPITVVVASSAAQNAAAAAPGRARAPLSLRPDHVEADARIASLIPAYLRPTYLAVPSLGVVLIAGGWFALSRRPTRGRARPLPRRIKVQLASLDAVATAGDWAAFTSQARALLQEALAARWRIPAAQVTHAALQSRLGADGGEIRQLFLLADEARYGDRVRSAADFPRWTALVRRELLAGVSA